jgi:hypothetical protein
LADALAHVLPDPEIIRTDVKIEARPFKRLSPPALALFSLSVFRSPKADRF